MGMAYCCEWRDSYDNNNKNDLNNDVIYPVIHIVPGRWNLKLQSASEIFEEININDIGNECPHSIPHLWKVIQPK